MKVSSCDGRCGPRPLWGQVCTWRNAPTGAGNKLFLIVTEMSILSTVVLPLVQSITTRRISQLQAVATECNRTKKLAHGGPLAVDALEAQCLQAWSGRHGVGRTCILREIRANGSFRTLQIRLIPEELGNFNHVERATRSRGTSYLLHADSLLSPDHEHNKQFAGTSANY